MSIARHMIAALRTSHVRWPWRSERKPVVVEHVRYTKRTTPDPVEKARQMCRDMGREIPEALR